jgi:hypothetical protein
MAARLVSSTKNQQVLHVTPEFNGAKIAIYIKPQRKIAEKLRIDIIFLQINTN